MKTLLISALLLLANGSAYSLEKLKHTPPDLIGTWVYETGGESIDGCSTSRVVIMRVAVNIIRECVVEGRSIIRLKIKNVLVDRAFFSRKVKEYHVLTEGPNVVFDLLGDYGRSSIYLQFWVTDDYGPTQQLGVFNLYE